MDPVTVSLAVFQAAMALIEMCQRENRAPTPSEVAAVKARESSAKQGIKDRLRTGGR